MSKQEIEIAIRIRSHAEELLKTITAFRELHKTVTSIRAPLSLAVHAAGELDRELAKAARHKLAFTELQGRIKGRATGKNLSTGESVPHGMNASLAKLEGVLALPAARIGIAAGKLIIDGIAAGMERNAMVEDQVVAFTPLLKSADEAKQRIAELSNFAATSRFDLPSVAEASKTLEIFGGSALSTGDGLKMVGDSAAATGHPIQDVAQHMGVLYAALKNGTPVQDTTRRMVEMNLISAEQATRLNSLAESGGATGRAYEVLGETFGRFGGTMKAQGDTLGGLMRTLKETWLDDLGDITSGISGFTKEAIRSLLELQGVIRTSEEQSTDDAIKAYQRAARPTSAEDLSRQQADAQNKIDELEARITTARKRLVELEALTNRPMATGPAAVMPVQYVESNRLRQQLDQDLPALNHYKGIKKKLESDGHDNLAKYLEEKKREDEQATRKKSEHGYAEQLERNEASQLQRLEILRRQNLPLTEQAGLARADLARLETEKAGLSSLADRPNELRQKTLDLTEQTVVATARLLAIEKDVKEEARKTAAENIRNADAEKKRKEEEAERLKKEADTKRDALAASGKANEEAARKKFSESIQASDGDWGKTKLEKYNYKKALLLRERESYMSDEEYDSSLKKEGPDPESFAQQWQSVLVGLQNQWGSFAQQTASAFQSTFNSAISSISSGISGLILGTQTWSKALASIGASILTSVVNAIVQMGVRWIATQILMATAGKAIAAASTAATAPIAAAQSAVWATPATLATISSFGGAAAAAPGLIAGAQGITLAQSMAAFAEGGLTPGSRTLAWVGERGPELVLPADVTSRLSPQQQAMLLDGRLPAVAVAGDGAGASESSRGSRTVRQNHYHYWDRAQMIADSRDDISAIVHDVLRSRV